MVYRHGLWPFLMLALAVAMPAFPVRADIADQGAAICERAIVSGAQRGRACRRRCCTRSR